MISFSRRMLAGVWVTVVLPPFLYSKVIMTVSGPIPSDRAGLALAHEHVLVDFSGAEEPFPRRYETQAVVAKALPFFEQASSRGVRIVFECTPAFLARDVEVLQRLSESSGVRIVTNTGLYGAVDDKFLPSYAFTESAEELAARWIKEFEQGIDGTAVRPGFIKSAVDRQATLSEVDRKLVKAAALTHKATGLTIAVHTASGPGLAQLDILAEQEVAPSAWIWTHAHRAEDADLEEAANRGAWLSFDGLRVNSLQRHLDLCIRFRERGQLDQVLFSHDAGWFDPRRLDGGPFRGYTLLFDQFMPMLREAGFSEEDLSQLLESNPNRAFEISVRMFSERDLD